MRLLARIGIEYGLLSFVRTRQLIFFRQEIDIKAAMVGTFKMADSKLSHQVNTHLPILSHSHSFSTTVLSPRFWFWQLNSEDHNSSDPLQPQQWRRSLSSTTTTPQWQELSYSLLYFSQRHRFTPTNFCRLGLGS